MTLTREFAFGIGLALLVGVLLYTGVKVNEAREAELPSPRAAIVHGIVTDWASLRGEHRVWTVTAGAAYPEWIDEHVAAFTLAQQVLTPMPERK